MDLETLPLLNGFRAAFREHRGDRVLPDARVCCDYLMEQGATLADVLRLYAGSPPEWLAPDFWEDEGFRYTLGVWLYQMEPKKNLIDARVWVDGREQGLFYDGRPRASRWRCVQACEFWEIDGDQEADQKPALRRAQKRRVLALFPDAKHRRLLRFPLPGSDAEMRRIMGQAEAWLREGGWRVDVGITCTQDETAKEIRYEQVLAAPDWIPPEPEYGPSPLRGAFTAFRNAPLMVVAGEPLAIGDEVVPDDNYPDGAQRIRRARPGEIGVGRALGRVNASEAVRVQLYRDDEIGARSRPLSGSYSRFVAEEMLHEGDPVARGREPWLVRRARLGEVAFGRVAPVGPYAPEGRRHAIAGEEVRVRLFYDPDGETLAGFPVRPAPPGDPVHDLGAPDFGGQ